MYKNALSWYGAGEISMDNVKLAHNVVIAAAKKWTVFTTAVFKQK